MLLFDSIPASIRRCIHYFIFTMAAIIVAVGLLIMQRKKGNVGDYIVVTGVLVLMIGILLLSKEYRGRGSPSLPSTQSQGSTTTAEHQPPRNDPPPSYRDAWRESYLEDQEKKKAELDPPPPAYRESWSKGLWKKYFQSGRNGFNNHLYELNASTLPSDVENATSLPKPDDVSQVLSSLQENECSPPITPVLVPPAGEGEGSQTSAASLENTGPGLERRRASFASTSTAPENSERVRQRSCSVTQLSSMFENAPSQGPELPTVSRGDDGVSVIEPSQLVYVYESGRQWVVDN